MSNIQRGNLGADPIIVDHDPNKLGAAKYSKGATTSALPPEVKRRGDLFTIKTELPQSGTKTANDRQTPRERIKELDKKISDKAKDHSLKSLQKVTDELCEIIEYTDKRSPYFPKGFWPKVKNFIQKSLEKMDSTKYQKYKDALLLVSSAMIKKEAYGFKEISPILDCIQKLIEKDDDKSDLLLKLLLEIELLRHNPEQGCIVNSSSKYNRIETINKAFDYARQISQEKNIKIPEIEKLEQRREQLLSLDIYKVNSRNKFNKSL